LPSEEEYGSEYDSEEEKKEAEEEKKENEEEKKEDDSELLSAFDDTS